MRLRSEQQVLLLNHDSRVRLLLRPRLAAMLLMESARIAETSRNLPMVGGSFQEYLF
jgi:hypothetical protein